MILATTFVFIQTPATGIAQAGLLRRKNVLSMITQTMIGVTLGSLLYCLVGFSLFWGESWYGLIGKPWSYPMLWGVSLTKPFPNHTIPSIVYCAFQMMFALMTPTLATAAWSEKFTLWGFVGFLVTWPILVYYPLAHWLWNPHGWLTKWGVQDFAGGIVIHASVGVSGLVVAAMLKHRRYMENASKVHHNMPLFATGSFFIWAGWYFFNGGSALAANYQSGTAMLNTHLAASCGSLTWTVIGYWETRKFSLGYFISGALAGLGGITAGSGFVAPQGAMCIGTLASLSSFVAMKYVQASPHFDDVLDCFALQGANGIVGATLVGVFGDSTIAGVDGLAYGGDATLLGKQFTAAVVGSAWAALMTYMLMKAMRALLSDAGLEVNDLEDAVGLDLYQIGEPGYDGSLYCQEDKILLADKVCTAIDRGEHDSLMWLKEIIYDTMHDMYIGTHNGAGRSAFHAVASLNAGLFWMKDEEKQKQLEEELRGFDGDVTSDACLVWLGKNSEACQVATMLLEMKVCINECDHFKRTPLQYSMDALGSSQALYSSAHITVRERHLTAMVSFLRSKGAIANPEAALSRLCTAAMGANLPQMKLLLSWPGVVDLADYDKRTALHVACDEWMANADKLQPEKKAVVQYLLYKNASTMLPDRWGNTVLDEVAARIEVAERANLQSAGDEPHKNMELESLKELQDLLNTHEDELDVPPELKDDGSDVSSESSYPEHPINRESLPLLVVNPMARAPQLEKGIAEQALAYASSAIGVEPLKRLRLSGRQYASIKDCHGLTLLHVACLHGRQSIVSWLLQLQPEDCTRLLMDYDHYGHTPMYTAVTACHREDSIARILRERYSAAHDGAEWPNDDKLGYLYCSAAKEGNMEFLNALRLSGGLIDDQDYDNRTALHLAASEGHVDIVDWLISLDDKKSQLHAVDRQGRTPYEDTLALKKYHQRRMKRKEPGARDDYKKYRTILQRLKVAMGDTAGTTGKLLYEDDYCEAQSHMSLRERLEDHPFRPAFGEHHVHHPAGAGSHHTPPRSLAEHVAGLGTEDLESLIRTVVSSELEKRRTSSSAK